ncbi:ATP-binding protein [Intrasporangium calvum]|uniref:ATP-binding protein n=1 Tax=Intrasporangium calvum TaxID=53358 RepID=UPI003CC7E4BF
MRDDEPGVPPEDRERIFERFTHLDDARARDRGGSGLGLAINRETSLARGGSLHVMQDTSDGALFELRLPCGRDEGSHAGLRWLFVASGP